MRRVTMQVLLLAFAAAAASARVGAEQARLAPVTTSEAAVTVKVTPRMSASGAWEFDLVFDTHTRALNDDLLKTAVLVAPDGTQLLPLEWKGAPPGGHHRAGTLRFKALDPAPAILVLRLTRSGEPGPRIFQWKLN